MKQLQIYMKFVLSSQSSNIIQMIITEVSHGPTRSIEPSQNVKLDDVDSNPTGRTHVSQDSRYNLLTSAN